MLETFIAILILGALAGGRSFGGVITKGIVCLILLFVIAVVVMILGSAA